MGDRHFSFGPRPAQHRGAQAIGEFIRRVNAEPGGFRGINSAELRRQMQAQPSEQDATRRHDDVDMAGTASDAESDGDGDESKDIASARDDILRAIQAAHQTAMFALDFASLLLSKENPAQAVATFSPGLRDMVGVGTLGATVLDAPTALTQSRVPDNKMVAIGKRLMDLNKAADSALAASKRLQREIVLETKYWSEVLAVSEHGWQAFRLPNEPHTMAVKFGFSNTAPEFKTSGVAPMRRAEDGTVRLEHGKMGSGSKRIQVNLLENGLVVGNSSLPPPLPADAPLQDRVKESRNTVFAQELWHELNREGRTLLSRNARLEKSAVTYSMDATRTMSLQLVTLGEADGTVTGRPGPQDPMAESLCITLCLLLSNSHRMNEQRRSEPTINTGSPPPYSLLSPLISYYKYDHIVQQCMQSLAAFISVLRSAGLDSCITIKEPPLSAPPGAPASTALAAALLRPPPVQFDLAITPQSRLRVLTKPSPLSGAVFAIFHLPPAQPEAKNPLTTDYPPGTDEYDRLEDLLWYLHRAVPRALVAHYVSVLDDSKPAADGTEPRQGSPESSSPLCWNVHSRGKGFVHSGSHGDELGVHFDFVADPSTDRLELRVKGDLVEDGNKVEREWTWPGAKGSLDAAVKKVLSIGSGVA